MHTQLTKNPVFVMKNDEFEKIVLDSQPHNRSKYR